jgi:hypothetical protein
MTGWQQPPPYLTAPRPDSRQRPAASLDALATQLRAAGITRLYSSACTLFGVLSIAYGLTVWTNGRLLWWQTGNEHVTWTAADPEGAARILAAVTRNLNEPEPSGGP